LINKKNDPFGVVSALLISKDIKGLVKNEGNKEARSPYVMCKYYVGDKLYRH